jgi:predicted DNA binding CopG/RHH family protein
MSKKTLNTLHNFILEQKPTEDELREKVAELAYKNDPTDRTITVRYSQFKKHIRELHSTYSDDFLKTLNPPKELTAKIIDENKQRKMSAKQVNFGPALVEKIYALKDSESPFERAIYLQFISGRRINEIFDSQFRIVKKTPRVVTMQLSKKNGDEKSKYHKMQLIKDTVTNEEFKVLLNRLRSSVAGMSLKDYTNRVNRAIKSNLGKDLSSHDLRAMYSVYRYTTDNPDAMNLIGYIGSVLNHGPGSVDSAVSYSNFNYTG